MILTTAEKHLIVSTYRLVLPIQETVADLFYRRLFEDEPGYRQLFPEDMGVQKRKLMTMFKFITGALSWTDAQWKEDVALDQDLFLVVLALGRRHHTLSLLSQQSYRTPLQYAVFIEERGIFHKAST